MLTLNLYYYQLFFLFKHRRVETGSCTQDQVYFRFINIFIDTNVEVAQMFTHDERPLFIIIIRVTTIYFLNHVNKQMFG